MTYERHLVSVVVGSALCAFVACSAGGGGAGPGVSGSSSSSGSGGSGVGGSGSSTSTSGSGGTGVVIDPSDSGQAGDTGCDSKLEVTYRDFDENHPDFEMEFKGDVVRRGLIAPALGPDLKPVFMDTHGCPAVAMTAVDADTGNCWTSTGSAVITSADTFAQWYNTSDVNREFQKTIALTETPPGSGEFVYETTEFFPLETTEGFGMTPANHWMMRNFLFTTEIHVSFGYVAGQKFTFRGDDDLWIFVNGKLALDLGSMHGAEEGTIDFDAQAATLGIFPGNTYSMDIFHAERHTDASNFKVTTNISCFTPVVVK